MDSARYTRILGFEPYRLSLAASGKTVGLDPLFLAANCPCFDDNDIITNHLHLQTEVSSLNAAECVLVGTCVEEYIFARLIVVVADVAIAFLTS